MAGSIAMRSSGCARCCMPTRTPSSLQKLLPGLTARGVGGSRKQTHAPSKSPPPRRGPDNTTVREKDRTRARKLYHHQCRRKHTTPCLSSTREDAGDSACIYTPSPSTRDPSQTGGHAGTMMPPKQTPTNVPPTSRADALILPDTDLATHAGEQISGVSRYSDEDPGQSRNDLGSMHTFSVLDLGSMHAFSVLSGSPQPRKHSP